MPTSSRLTWRTPSGYRAIHSGCVNGCRRRQAYWLNTRAELYSSVSFRFDSDESDVIVQVTTLIEFIMKVQTIDSKCLFFYIFVLYTKKEKIFQFFDSFFLEANFDEFENYFRIVVAHT